MIKRDDPTIWPGGIAVEGAYLIRSGPAIALWEFDLRDKDPVFTVDTEPDTPIVLHLSPAQWARVGDMTMAPIPTRVEFPGTEEWESMVEVSGYTCRVAMWLRNWLGNRP